MLGGPRGRRQDAVPVGIRAGGKGLEGAGPQTLPACLPSSEEKAELLLDSQAEVQGLEAEIRRLRQEVRSDVPRHGRAFLNPFPAPSPSSCLLQPVPSRPNPCGWRVAGPSSAPVWLRPRR